MQNVEHPLTAFPLLKANSKGMSFPFLQGGLTMFWCKMRFFTVTIVGCSGSPIDILVIEVSNYASMTVFLSVNIFQKEVLVVDIGWAAITTQQQPPRK